MADGLLFENPAADVSDRGDYELITDSFAGGGGASTGIEMALGRSPDFAINHDEKALAMHAANHPNTVHLSKNIWQVDPLEIIGRRPVGLSWFSPDCKHFSKAKGSKPVSKNIRDLGWVVVLWAKRVRPRIIALENVEEFQDWGPLTEDGQPCAKRKGQTFRKWVSELERLGYRVEWRELRACDYGAPTIRKRLFLIARCDGRPIVWPEPTHGDPDSDAVKTGALKPWKVAADIIDFNLPCPSIFDTSEEIMETHGLRAIRPLADNTLKRIARGIVRYVLDAKEPFLVSYAQQGGGNRSGFDPLHTICASPKDQNTLVVPTLVQTGYGERVGQAPRALDINAPIGTQVAGGAKHALVAAFLAQHNTGVVGHSVTDPVSTLTMRGTQQTVIASHLVSVAHGESGGRREYLMKEPLRTGTQKTDQAVVAASMVNLRGTEDGQLGGRSIMSPVATVSAGGGHAGLIAAFLTKYYGQGFGASVSDPLHTDTTRDRFGLVTVDIDGQTFAIADIGMRMLTPRERFRAQGFPDSYQIEEGVLPDGRHIRLGKTDQGRMCGNSVCPPLAAAIIAANAPELADENRIRNVEEIA